LPALAHGSGVQGLVLQVMHLLLLALVMVVLTRLMTLDSLWDWMWMGIP
jgi:hypothetical protein